MKKSNASDIKRFNPSTEEDLNDEAINYGLKVYKNLALKFYLYNKNYIINGRP